MSQEALLKQHFDRAQNRIDALEEALKLKDEQLAARQEIIDELQKQNEGLKSIIRGDI